jgi:hypothetical protein
MSRSKSRMFKTFFEILRKLMTYKKLSPTFLRDLPIHDNLEIHGNLSRREIY